MTPYCRSNPGPHLHRTPEQQTQARDSRGLEIGVEGVSDDLAFGLVVGCCPLFDPALVAGGSAERVNLGPRLSDPRRAPARPLDLGELVGCELAPLEVRGHGLNLVAGQGLVGLGLVAHGRSSVR